jgi:hypothetical protein
VRLYPHDIEEVMRIRPMLYGRDDMVAWAYEKSDIFTECLLVGYE